MAAHRWAGVVGLLFAILAGRTSADPLIASAGVLTRLILTDNLFLTSQAPESGEVLQLLPNISGGGAGRRASWRLYYGPSALFYAGHAELNRVFHVFGADAKYQIIDEYLALQVTANANQNLVNPGAQNVGFTALGNPNAFGQTAAIQVTPLIRFPLLHGDFATVEFAPGINYVFAAKTVNGNTNNGSSGSQSTLNIRSGPSFARWSWAIEGSTNRVFGASSLASESVNGSGANEVNGTVTYPITNRWKLQGLVGYDWGNYGNQLQAAPQWWQPGWRWRLTPQWSPSRGTVIALGYGNRFGAPDYYANISYEHKKTVLTATYETSVSNARTSILNSSPVAFQDPYGQPIVQPLANQTLSGSVLNPALQPGYAIADQLTLSATQQFGRTTATLTVNDYRWEYQDSPDVNEQRQGQLTLSRNLSRRATGTLAVEYWIYNQSTAASGDFDQVMMWTEFSYAINRRTTGRVRYSYSKQTSPVTGGEFDANSLWLTLNWTM